MEREDIKTPRSAGDIRTVSSINSSDAKVEIWAVQVPPCQSKFPETALFALQQAEVEGPHVALLFITVLETESHEKESPGSIANGGLEIRLTSGDWGSYEWEREREREWESEVKAMLEHLVAVAADKHVHASFHVEHIPSSSSSGIRRMRERQDHLCTMVRQFSAARLYLASAPSLSPPHGCSSGSSHLSPESREDDSGAATGGDSLAEYVTARLPSSCRLVVVASKDGDILSSLSTSAKSTSTSTKTITGTSTSIRTSTGTGTCTSTEAGMGTSTEAGVGTSTEAGMGISTEAGMGTCAEIGPKAVVETVTSDLQQAAHESCNGHVEGGEEPLHPKATGGVAVSVSTCPMSSTSTDTATIAGNGTPLVTSTGTDTPPATPNSSSSNTRTVTRAGNSGPSAAATTDTTPISYFPHPSSSPSSITPSSSSSSSEPKVSSGRSDIAQRLRSRQRAPPTATAMPLPPPPLASATAALPTTASTALPVQRVARSVSQASDSWGGVRERESGPGGVLQASSSSSSSSSLSHSHRGLAPEKGEGDKAPRSTAGRLLTGLASTHAKLQSLLSADQPSSSPPPPPSANAAAAAPSTAPQTPRSLQQQRSAFSASRKASSSPFPHSTPQLGLSMTNGVSAVTASADRASLAANSNAKSSVLSLVGGTAGSNRPSRPMNPSPVAHSAPLSASSHSLNHNLRLSQPQSKVAHLPLSLPPDPTSSPPNPYHALKQPLSLTLQLTDPASSSHPHSPDLSPPSEGSEGFIHTPSSHPRSPLCYSVSPSPSQSPATTPNSHTSSSSPSSFKTSGRLRGAAGSSWLGPWSSLAATSGSSTVTAGSSLAVRVTTAAAAAVAAAAAAAAASSGGSVDATLSAPAVAQPQSGSSMTTLSAPNEMAASPRSEAKHRALRKSRTQGGTVDEGSVERVRTGKVRGSRSLRKAGSDLLNLPVIVERGRERGESINPQEVSEREESSDNDATIALRVSESERGPNDRSTRRGVARRRSGLGREGGAGDKVPLSRASTGEVRGDENRVAGDASAASGRSAEISEEQRRGGRRVVIERKRSLDSSMDEMAFEAMCKEAGGLLMPEEGDGNEEDKAVGVGRREGRRGSASGRQGVVEGEEPPKEQQEAGRARGTPRLAGVNGRESKEGSGEGSGISQGEQSGFKALQGSGGSGRSELMCSQVSAWGSAPEDEYLRTVFSPIKSSPSRHQYSHSPLRHNQSVESEGRCARGQQDVQQQQQPVQMQQQPMRRQQSSLRPEQREQLHGAERSREVKRAGGKRSQSTGRVLQKHNTHPTGFKTLKEELAEQEMRRGDSRFLPVDDWAPVRPSSSIQGGRQGRNTELNDNGRVLGGRSSSENRAMSVGGRRVAVERGDTGTRGMVRRSAGGSSSSPRGSGLVRQSSGSVGGGSGLVRQSSGRVGGGSGLVRQSSGSVGSGSGLMRQTSGSVGGGSGLVRQTSGSVGGGSSLVRQSSGAGEVRNGVYRSNSAASCQLKASAACGSVLRQPCLPGDEFGDEDSPSGRGSMRSINTSRQRQLAKRASAPLRSKGSLELVYVHPAPAGAAAAGSGCPRTPERSKKSGLSRKGNISAAASAAARNGDDACSGGKAGALAAHLMPPGITTNSTLTPLSSWSSSSLSALCPPSIPSPSAGTASSAPSMDGRRFTLDELRAATDNFSVQNLLGRGSYGPVYRGELHGCEVAVKLLDDCVGRAEKGLEVGESPCEMDESLFAVQRRLQQLVSQWADEGVGNTSGKLLEGSRRGQQERKGRQGEAEFRTEVEVLSRMRHPHVVLLMGHCPEVSAIVYEFMTAGSLQTRLLEHRKRHAGEAGRRQAGSRGSGGCRMAAGNTRNTGRSSSSGGEEAVGSITTGNKIKNGSSSCTTTTTSNAMRPPLTWPQRIRIAADISRGLLYLHCHDPPIVHRDLKPDNILLDAHGVAKIADVGLAKLMHSGEGGDAGILYGDLAGEGTSRGIDGLMERHAWGGGEAGKGFRLTGTIGFIAPETVEGGEASPQTDVYAFGCILLMLAASCRSIQQVHALLSSATAAAAASQPGAHVAISRTLQSAACVHDSDGSCSHEGISEDDGERREEDAALLRVQAAVAALQNVLEPSAGQCSGGVVRRFLELAVRCVERDPSFRPDLLTEIRPELLALAKQSEDEEVATVKRRQLLAQEQFTCPLSKERMQDPVVAADGVTYERVHIERWLLQEDVSPITGQVLAHKSLSQNQLLLSLMELI